MPTDPAVPEVYREAALARASLRMTIEHLGRAVTLSKCRKESGLFETVEFRAVLNAVEMVHDRMIEFRVHYEGTRTGENVS